MTNWIKLTAETQPEEDELILLYSPAWHNVKPVVRSFKFLELSMTSRVEYYYISIPERPKGENTDD